MKSTQNEDTQIYSYAKNYIHEKTGINKNNIEVLIAKRNKIQNHEKYWDNFIITFLDKKDNKKKTLINGILKN